MKKTSSQIRQEIAKLQDVLKAAETREAERIGRIALKAGLGEIEIEDGTLQAAFEDIAKGFRTKRASHAPGSLDTRIQGSKFVAAPQLSSDAAQGSLDEA